MALPSALDIIAQKESAGKNVRNYKYGPGFTASGYYQMIKGTWQRWAKAAGIDISKYPEAIDAPKEVQDAVALQGFKMEGFKPWEATKHLVGQEGNYAAGGTGAAYPVKREGAGGIPGGVVPSDLPAGGLPPESIISSPPAGGGASSSPPPATARTIHDVEEQLKREFPELRVTSAYRSPEYNKKVGGAKNSQHTHGTAIDIGLKELPEATRIAIVNRAVALGVRGIGYYPNSQSIHIDMREGAPQAWGGNKSRTSLPQTPPWFQEAAAKVLAQTGSTGAAYPARDPNAGYTPSELPAGGIPAPPAGVLTPGAAPAPLAPTSAPAAAPAAPVAPYSAAPNSDAARMLSDPTRYGLSPDQASAMRAQMAAGGPGGGTFGNIPAPPQQPQPAPAPPAGVLSPTDAPAPPPTNAPAIVGTAMAPEPVPPLPPPRPPEEPGAQGTAMALLDDRRNRRPPSLLQGGWT